MITWLKKLNRKRNLYLNKKKLSLKLRFICFLSARNKSIKNTDTTAVKHLLFVIIGKGIGDAIIIGGAIEILLNHGYQVSVIADKRTYFLFEQWSNLHSLYYYDAKKTDKIIEQLKNAPPFVFIDSNEITHSSINTFNLMRLAKPYQTIGFTHKYNIYDIVISIKTPLGHASTRYIDLLEHFNIRVSNYDYNVVIPQRNIDEANELAGHFKNKKLISFIPYGSVIERCFSKEQINAIIDCLSQYRDTFQIIIIGEQHRIKEIKDTGNVTKNHYKSFFTSAQIIKYSSLVISPDTSIVHLSRAFDKRLICIYPFKILDNIADNSIVWGPNYNQAIQIKLKEKRIMDSDISFIIKQIDKEMKSHLS